jgi:hypothetical protein
MHSTTNARRDEHNHFLFFFRVLSISADVGEDGMRNKDGGCQVENGGTKNL